MQYLSESQIFSDECVPVVSDSCVNHQVVMADEMNLYEGAALMADKQSGKIIILSTRNSRDSDRWSLMPSVETFKDSLMMLDLHNSRYIQFLHESVGDLHCLKYLMITRCTNLRSLTESLGSLSNLEEVGPFFFTADLN